MLVHGTEQVGDEEYSKMIEALEDYLPTADDFEESDDLEILKRMKGNE